MNILLLASHAVAEYDDLRMLTDLGYDVFAPGGYEIPSRSGEGIRPPLPDAPHHSDLLESLQAVRVARGDPGPMIDWGKAALPDDVIDWADAIIVHHFPERWIGGQWDRIKHKRVIWRTCGQSDVSLERYMGLFRTLEIVRYSPAERRYFEPRSFAGQDALIRFGKYPDDYGPWIGDWPCVINFTQNMKQRGDACGYAFWEAATSFLPTNQLDGKPYRLPSGAGSEEIGGQGEVSYPLMLDNLRHARAYLYTGTRPASYTLGLIEAMLSGVPVVSIGPEAWGEGWDGADLFEGHEIAAWSDNRPSQVRIDLERMLGGDGYAEVVGDLGRKQAVRLFGIDTVGPQWKAFLG